MKKIFILFAALLMLCSFLQAQTGFSKSGSEWIVEYHWKRFNQYRDTEFHYSLGRDTLIMDDTWKVLSQDGIPVGAMLEKDRKVWYHPYNHTNQPDIPSKILFYDFSKEKGDTIHFDAQCHIFESLMSLDAHNDVYRITIEDVKYELGRKIMYLSDGDCWIEGIGSPEGFLGKYLLRANDYSSSSIALTQMRSDGKTTFFQDRLIDQDRQSGLLEEGKQWYVKSIDQANTYYLITLGAPDTPKGSGRYPVSRIRIGNEQQEQQPMGYLYEVNKQIYWDNETLKDILIYNFNLTEGNDFGLWIDFNEVTIPQEPRVYGTSLKYTVTKTDTVLYNNIPRRRIILEHETDIQTWIEGIGAISDPLYTDINRNRHMVENKTKNTLTCCYLNGQPLYHDPQYTDCVETSIGDILLPSDFYKINNERLIISHHDGYTLSLYDISGRLLCKKAISSSESSVDLQGLPEILVGKLTLKGGNTLSFKIIHKK